MLKGVLPLLWYSEACACEQVLSNADLRAKYDAHGVEGLDVNFMDSAEFFSMLFGSDRFEHLLGELSLAQMTRYRQLVAVVPTLLAVQVHAYLHRK